MTKEQYAEMLKDISETHKQGGNISACIESISFVNPAIVAPFSKNITSDIVAEDQHLDRIVLEVQHVCGDSYRDRLVLYTAKHTVASRVKGEDYKLRNLNLISLQMFNGFPESSNYRHTIRLKNQDNEVYFDKQTITLVEIPKFLTGKHATDNSRLAQWLRAIDELNKEEPVDVPNGTLFQQLQE